MVIDTSAILAIFFNEPHAEWVAGLLNQHSRELRMSTVNLTETLIRLQDRQPQLFNKLSEQLFHNGIRFVPPDVNQAKLVANARLKYPLNLGDCFAYALADVEKCPIITLDRDFKVLDIPILYPD